ncbi:glutathione transferase 1 [Mariannaea sp. PMI_226]|nr:glutathione transferase 1 [Mariannaea sp. PMI_226]
MSSDLKPITLYVHIQGPNPKKVLIILEELGIPYKAIPIHDPKDESYLKINPNGRLPAIVDPNNDDLALWESGAIVEYLVENYDKENKLTFTSNPEKWQLKQYLHFQMSGQGPYYGQNVWFNHFHPEPVPSAKERYREQTIRVLGVLDGILEGKEYLVGDKCTYADLAFVPWNNIIGFMGDTAEKANAEENYKNYFAWHQRLLARPAVQRALNAKADEEEEKK